MKQLDRALLLLLCGVSLVTLICSAGLGSTDISLARILSALLMTGGPLDQIVIWEIRIPRAVAAYLVGMSLGMSGAALQGLLRNPLAEPGVLGVTSVSSLFAATSMFLGIASYAAWILPIFAVVGALIATFLIALIAQGQKSMITLIIAGVGLSGFATALMSLMMNMSSNPFTLNDMINWMLGTVANRSFDDIVLVFPFLAIGMTGLFIWRRGLSALSLGEETASTLGLNIASERLKIVCFAGLATGGAVALSGAIGFVGIFAPHFVRSFVGYDPSRTLLPAGLLGGILLVIADILVRLLPTTNELKLGVVAALIGAPVFVWLAVKMGADYD